jgi:hypothetical protein
MSAESTFRIAVAARYADRREIQQFLDLAQLTHLPVQLTATWLTATAEQDADLTDAQAEQAAETNWREISDADLLLYFPCWAGDRAGRYPFWSPGRLIDFGIAVGSLIPILVVGQPEPTIYQRGAQVSVCERTPMALYRAVKGMVR